MESLTFFMGIFRRAFAYFLSLPLQVGLGMSEVKNTVEDYPLSRDYVDFNRLNLQHYIVKDMFGYSLHPKIPRTQTGLKIADVGTGTGIWLLDLLPLVNSSTELVGIDNDITQVGPKEWLPENLTLRNWSIFTDVPDDLAGVFDIVNIRHFAFVIEGDATPTLRKLKKLLKPGGYLQWCDVDVPSFRIKTASPNVSTDCLMELWENTMPKGTRLFPKWVKGLPESFGEEGFVDIITDWHEQKGHTGIAMHWCNLSIHEMLVGNSTPANPEKSSNSAIMIEKASTESRQGAMYAFDRVVVVGRKPLT